MKGNRSISRKVRNEVFRIMRAIQSKSSRFMKFDNVLYHYTKFESALKIIASEHLLFSQIENLNDINEATGPNILFSNKEDSEAVLEIIKDYGQISFTIDGKKKGYDIPAMWGHYADRGKGVCVVLDREKILINIEKAHYWKGEIKYVGIENPAEYFYDKLKFHKPEDFIYYSKETLFFHKSADWSYEQEFRILNFGPPTEVVDIHNCIKAIILCYHKHDTFKESAEYKAFKMIGLPVFRYFPLFGEGELYDEAGDSLRPPLTYNFANIKNIFEVEED